MHTIEVNAVFSAAHAIVIAGQLEPIHGHDWHLTIILQGEELDSEGLLCDFHAVEAHLTALIAPFRNGNFNETPPFDKRNPTAEHIAMHFGKHMQQYCNDQTQGRVTLKTARITEAPGCAAAWEPTYKSNT